VKNFSEKAKKKSTISGKESTKAGKESTKAGKESTFLSADGQLFQYGQVQDDAPAHRRTAVAFAFS
jgi:hypothetical protein